MSENEVLNLFTPLHGLNLVAHFTVPKVRTWGSKEDQVFKQQLRSISGLKPGDGDAYTWFAFRIVCRLAKSRERIKHQVPDVENIPKLIVDAFTGLLYPDDNLTYVRGVQVEAEFSADETEWTEVWIYGMPGRE